MPPRPYPAAVTLLCVSIFVDDIDVSIADMTEARHRGADLIELRIDPYYSGTDDDVQLSELARLVAAAPLPCILTCRPVLEGGQYDGPDDARISMLEYLCVSVPAAAGQQPAPAPPRYIDVELATYTRSHNIRQKVNLCVQHPDQLRDVRTKLLLSMHDFQGRPEDFFRRISQMAAEPASAVSKVAYRARSLRDNLELLDLLAEAREAGRALIALGMGPFGLMSRVLAAKFDGFLTFASLRRSTATAPGQPTLEDLLSLYRVRAHTPATRVYGVIGWPVEHSVSPQAHNAAFEAAEHDGVYMHMPVAPGYEPLRATLLAMIDHPRLDFAGCSVTIPHKENLIALAAAMRQEGDERWSVDALSAACGAANTLTVQRDARGRASAISISNSDGPAASGLLRTSLGTLTGHTIVVLGAGGTARAVAASIVMDGGRVIIINRTPAKAEALASELRTILRCDEAHLSALIGPREALLQALSSCSGVYHCTPAGMSGGPAPELCPLDDDSIAALSPHCIVADSVYRPLRTPLLAAAQARGLQTLSGLQLFVAQAAAQSQLFTGAEPSRGMLTQVAREALALDEHGLT